MILNKIIEKLKIFEEIYLTLAREYRFGKNAKSAGATGALGFGLRHRAFP